MGNKDNRRITGPDNTTPISILKGPVTSFSFIDENKHRNDGRSSQDLREIYLGVTNISQAKGSSYIELGNTKVVCGVYGPRESPHSNTFKAMGTVNCEIKLAPFCRDVRKSLIPDSQVKELSTQVKETLEAVIILDQYPKSQIDIFISVIEDGGSILAACINAAGLALTNANIQMFDIVVATSLVWHEGEIYLDPTSKEEDFVTSVAKDSDNSNGQLTLAYMPAYAKGQISLMVQSGTVSCLDLQQGMEVALDACKKMYSIVKQVIYNELEDLELEETKD